VNTRDEVSGEGQEAFGAAATTAQLIRVELRGGKKLQKGLRAEGK